MNATRLVLALASIAPMCTSLRAEPMHPVDLQEFAGGSEFEVKGVDWLLPRGAQVIDGIPWQLGGVVVVLGTDATFGHAVTNVPVGRTFERFYALGAATGKGEVGPLAFVGLHYEDGTSVSLDVQYGRHLGDWQGPWHIEEPTLLNPETRIAWRQQSAISAEKDNYLRLFRFALDNPNPDRLVTGLSVRSALMPCSVMLAAITVGPREFEPLPDTVTPPGSPFPDLRKRSGRPASVTGIVEDAQGNPQSGLAVLAVKTRPIPGHDSSSDPLPEDPVLTDDAGRFSITNQRDDRLYHLLVIGTTGQLAEYPGADPLADPVVIRFKSQPTPKTNAPFTVVAHVLGPDRQPVVGALAEVGGLRTGRGTSWGGNTLYGKRFLTDDAGRIEIGGTNAFDALQVTFTAPGLAPNMLFLDRTNENQVVQMDVGASLRGRVVKDSQPLANVGVGVSGTERSSEVYAGHYEVLTDTNGVFEFAHLPKRTEWWVFGRSASLKEHGAIRPRKVTTGEAGTEQDLNDLEVGRGYRVSGVVRTRDGRPLPADLRLHISMEDLWDSQSMQPDESGAFRASGLPTGKISVSVQARDWHLSGLNRSIDDWNPFRLTGQLSDDADGLEVIIELGRWESQPSFTGQLPTTDHASSRPLHGAEASGPPWIVINGTVLDDASGAAITNATLTPGYQPPVAAPVAAAQKPLLQQLVDTIRDKPAQFAWNERPVWQEFRAESVTNGMFTARFLPLSSQPLLRLEAPGYEPYVSESPSVVTNGLAVRLRRGTGPDGFVLTPKGQPAANASVYYGAGGEQFSLGGGTIISVYGREEFKQQTGADGSFSFPQRPDGRILFVAHPTGWAEKDVREGGNKLKVRLEPWAAIAGTLVDTNGAAMPAVELHLTRMHDWQTGDPFPNLQHVAATDGQGRFLFTNVPPGRLDVVRFVPMTGMGNGWTHQPQTWLYADPGKTNDLGKVTYDTPPPPPFTDQLKQKLGL